MNRLRMFMMGRYGTDQLSMAIIILGMLLTFIGDLISSSILTLLSYLVFGFCIYRMLSKNIAVRQQENYKFLKVWNPAKKSIQPKIEQLKGMRTYKYFKCPNCKQTLRAPRGKGKIAVTCRKCNTKFNQKV